jgi:DNA-binding IclR family transcriptional regulator
VSRDAALREIARCFLAGAGMTIPGELARVTGLSRPEAGRGNRALVAEGYATMLAAGVYQLRHLVRSLGHLPIERYRDMESEC